jgi:FRG domain
MDHFEFDSWPQFQAWVQNYCKMHDSCPTYWRGQKDPDWPLASRFERMILGMFGGRPLPGRPPPSMIYPYDNRYIRPGGKKLWEPNALQQLRDRYLWAFKRAAAGLRGPNPATLDQDQWWALGRHFGLITPLLDWSDSPYIAAFFALSERLADIQKAPGGGITFCGAKVAVYVLFHNSKLEGDGLRVVQPTVEELGRMHGQRGLFTWLDSEEYFELQGFLDHKGCGDLLTKVIISEQAVSDGLHDLAEHGIGYRLLFPDLQGAANHANSQFDKVF